MRGQRLLSRLLHPSLALLLLWPTVGFAQTFSSGSTGADGAFAPAANTTLTLPPTGIFNFTTVTVPAGVTVTFARNTANTPVTILATGDVTIAGSINVNGADGVPGSFGGPIINLGGAGGSAGFAGGNGGGGDGVSLPSAGQGPGGGIIGNNFCVSCTAGTYGAPSSFVSDLPLFGGSGGGGALGRASLSGTSGGGGGGAIVVASSTRISITGSVTANGGSVVPDFGCGDPPPQFAAGGGSGGAIRLVAPQVTGSGSLLASGGGMCFALTAGLGRIRIESLTPGFTGFADPTPSFSAAPGPVTVASNPALSNLPTLMISSVGGAAAPTVPTGSYATADVSLPQGASNPIPVILSASNIPVGTSFTVKIIPQSGDATSFGTAPSSGSFANSTATANVNLPLGQVSVLNAFASFTLPQLTGLFPLIDGEPVERVLVAANYGEPSTVTLITRSGKTVPAERVVPAYFLK